MQNAQLVNLVLFCVLIVVVFMHFSSQGGSTLSEDRDTLEVILERVPDVVGVLLQNLQQGGPYTFFAPTDEAFHAFAEQHLQSSDGTHTLLEELLATHVLPGAVLTRDVPEDHSLKLPTINGAELQMTCDRQVLGQEDCAVFVDGVKIVVGDLLVGAGVVHIIDDVLSSRVASMLTSKPAAESFQDEGEEDEADSEGAGAGPGGAGALKGGRRAGTRDHDRGERERERERGGKGGAAARGAAHERGGGAGREHEREAREREGHPRRPDKDKPDKGPSSLPAAAPALCSGHGHWKGDGQGGTCSCNLLYHGHNCQVAKKLQGLKLKEFNGHLVLNQEHLKGLADIKVQTPMKTLNILEAITPPIRSQINEILPKTDPLAGKSYASCALVGSAGTLMRANLGNDIDNHEMVMRFNAAPTRGYEKHVGTKTTIRVSNGEHLGFKEHRKELVLHHLRSHSFLVTLLKYNIKFPGQVPHILDPDFAAFVANSVAAIPSSGYFAILMALHMCRKVSLYGFYASNRHGARHHYYNSETPSNAGRDDTEFRMVLPLVRSGLVQFGEECVEECHETREACEVCFGGQALEELAVRERWTPQQRDLNQKRAADWDTFLKWDWNIDHKWVWEPGEGLVYFKDHSRHANDKS